MGPAATKGMPPGEEIKKNEWIKKGGYADLSKIYPRVFSPEAYDFETVFLFFITCKNYRQTSINNGIKLNLKQ